MKMLTLFVPISMLLLISCIDKKDKGITFNKEYNVTINKYSLDDRIRIADPTYIFVSENYIIWKDTFLDYTITIYDRTTKRTQRFLKLGVGPNEFAHEPHVYCFESEEGIIIETFTPVSNIVSQYLFQSIEQDSLPLLFSFPLTTNLNSKFSSDNPNEIKDVSIPMRGKRISESIYLSMGFFNSLFGLYLNGEYIKSTIDFIQPPHKKVSDFHQSASSLNTILQFIPSKDKVVLGYIFGKVLSVYSINDDIIIEDWSIMDFLPYYKISETGVTVQSDKTKYAYVDVAVTDDYIYALYSGRLVGENLDSHYANEVEIYSLCGKPVCKLILNAPLTCITVSKDNKFIYGFGSDTQTHNHVLYVVEVPGYALN